ncbi:hypothetical protein ABZ517_05615 [Streptomyces scabiei]|uniref:hypothetical protein n=1 Tax=Streptomyces scabiei TaxID=1930 RepID=UPI0033C42EF1
MRYEDRWAQCWPNVIPAVRHVETIALKNAWRGEALDKRFRIEAALELHHADDHQHCQTCNVAFPCPTYWALTTTTEWRRATEGQQYRLPLVLNDVQAAVAEMIPELVATDRQQPNLHAEKPVEAKVPSHDKGPRRESGALCFDLPNGKA